MRVVPFAGEPCEVENCARRRGHDGEHVDEDGKRVDEQEAQQDEKEEVKEEEKQVTFEADDDDAKRRRTDFEQIDWVGQANWMTRAPEFFESEVVRIEFDVGVKEFTKNPSLAFGKRMSAKGGEVTYRKLTPSEKKDMDEAMAKELAQVWTSAAVRKATDAEIKELDPARLMKMRWLLTWKVSDDGGAVAKARLIVLGFQHPDLTELQTAAPTLSRNGRNIILQIMAVHRLLMEAGDISSAFLQESSTSVEDENLYVKVPTELAELYGGDVLRLLSAFYGLTEAPRLFWQDVCRNLEKRGWKKMTTDRCCFVLLEGGHQGENKPTTKGRSS